MGKHTRYVGLDVHAETIAVAVAEPDGQVRSLGTIPNRVASIRKLVRKLGPKDKQRMCYEAGPTGYTLYWQPATGPVAEGSARRQSCTTVESAAAPPASSREAKYQ